MTPLVLRSAVAVCLLSSAVSSSAVHAQRQRQPDHPNIAYNNDDPAQKLDVYLADADAPVPAMVYIHGGGWRAGSKSRVPAWLLRGVESQQFSVVSVEYRFTNVAPHPAQTDDCLRAIQFTRHNAKDWNIDPQQIGVTGGSAGGHLSLYVALHDDVANAKADDPVKQHSSRAQFAIGFAGPTDWSLLKELPDGHKHPGYRQLVGSEPGTPFEELNAATLKDVSPITFASSDDPPVMIVHGSADDIVPVEHAHRLHKRLTDVGVDSSLVIVEGANHGVAGAGGREFLSKVESFTKKQLTN